MKYISISLLFITFYLQGNSQTLQLHFDPRHTINPQRNAKDYPTLYFEYFKNSDTNNTAKSLGPFLLKTQADLTGDKSNIGQLYIQVFQKFRLWKPKIYINLQYSGGLGVTDPAQYSYYIANSYSIGISYPFKLGSAFVSADFDYKLSAYKKPEWYPSYTFYFWQGLFHYKGEFSGDFSAWIQNKNHGDDATNNLQGKTFLFFAEPQLWYNLIKQWPLGRKLTSIIMY